MTGVYEPAFRSDTRERMQDAASVLASVDNKIRNPIRDAIADAASVGIMTDEAIYDAIDHKLRTAAVTQGKVDAKIKGGIVATLQGAYNHADNLGIPIPTYEQVRDQLALPPLLVPHQLPPDLAGRSEQMPPVPPDTLPSGPGQVEYWVACPADGPTGPVTLGSLPNVIGLPIGHHAGEYVTLASVGGRWWYLADGPHPTEFAADNATAGVQCTVPGSFPPPVPSQPPAPVPVPVPVPPVPPYCPPITPPCPPPPVIVNVPPCPPVTAGGTSVADVLEQEPDLGEFANIMVSDLTDGQRSKLGAYFGQWFLDVIDATDLADVAGELAAGEDDWSDAY